MSFAQWKSSRNRVAAKPAEGPVTRGFLSDGASLPVVYRPLIPNLGLSRWYADNCERIAKDLAEFGGILFRGFRVNDQADFEAFVEVAFGDKAAYVEGATPRTEIGKGIYTATEFPRDQEIALHNELSYVVKPPAKISFCCLKPAEEGGQTQIADITKVLAGIDPEIIEEFAARGGWMLQRNYGGGFGPTIQKAFGISDLEGIKRYCREADVEIEVVSDDRIVTRQIRAAVHRHPASGESIWFNHVAFWHPSSLCAHIRRGLDEMFSLSEFPYCTFFADGSEISDERVSAIRKAYRDAEVTFDWRAGDVMLLDNWRVAHGRKPFSGERRVIVSMG